MQITLYKFNKRENSTLQPSDEGLVIDCFLKENTSKYNPSFILNISDISYNYVKWGSQYYYVNEITSIENRVWLFDCEVDVLATWKNDIQNVSAFVLYSSSRFNDGIVDNRLSSDKDVIVSTSSTSLAFGGISGSYHVLSYIGDNGSDYVALTDEQLATLVTKIQSSEFAELFNDPSNAINKILTNTSACITSCIYNPLCVTGGVSEVVLAGGYYTSIGGRAVARNSVMDTELSIPWNFTDFRARSQFTSLLIYLPGYGFQPLNADNFVGKDSINIRATLDSVVGEITYIIDNKTRCTSIISSNEQISTTTTGRGSVLGMVAGAIDTAVTGVINPSSVFNTVISSLQTNPGSIGSGGGLTSYNAKKDITLYCISHNTNVEPSSLTSNYGRPLNEVYFLGSLSGYIECANASVSCSAPQPLKEKINSYLNGGFYNE